MQGVPKIVRDRLQAAPPAVNHPDADLLTAFTEQSLPEAERATVLDHLAHCGDCRDVVALALPPTEALETVATPARSGWLTWPALRWGFVAAGVVVIAGIGFLQLQRREATSMMAYKSPAVSVPESRSAALPPAAGAPAAEAGKQDKPEASSGYADSASSPRAAVSEPKPVVSAAPPPAAGGANAFHGAARGLFGGTVAHGPKAPSQFQLNTNAQQQVSNNGLPGPTANLRADRLSSAKQMPATTETGGVRGAAPMVEGETASQEYRSRDQSSGVRDEQADKISVSKTKLPVPLAAPGRILGYVVDPTGAVVPNARITITPTTMGGPATTVTNSQGAWLVAGLPTGNYKAQAEAPGFNPTVLAFSYDASQPSTYKLTLSPGSVSETVEVSSAQSLQGQTEPTNIAGSIANRDVSQIPVNGRVFAQLTSSSTSPVPRWTISLTGTLQRSFDQGNSWQSVDVNASAGSGASFEIVAKASRAKETEKDADKKALKRQAAAPTFRAVTAAGLEVWAGGSSGALYHSLDAGSHWTRVVPAFAGFILTGDIVGLEFPDPQHGRITTSTPEVWITSDAGQTWQKQ